MADTERKYLALMSPDTFEKTSKPELRSNTS